MYNEKNESSHMTKISVIAPAFNEAAGISSFLQEVHRELVQTGETFEIILVDDGSTDDTYEIATSLNIVNLKIIKLTRNFGHMAAIEAGLNESRGEIVITMDADLQHPPVLIPKMIQTYLERNIEFVQCIQVRTNEKSLLKKFLARIFYKIMLNENGENYLTDAGEFRLMSRKLVDITNSLPEREKVYRFLLPTLGFKYATIDFVPPKRVKGESKYSYKKLFSLAIQSILNFSTLPLRSIFTLASLSSIISLIYSAIIIYKFLLGNSPSGWTSLMLVILIFFSLQLFSIGIVGRYISQVLAEIRRRPHYQIEKTND